ncbi:hypothetical protein [Flavobacterium sp. PL002]
MSGVEGLMNTTQKHTTVTLSSTTITMIPTTVTLSGVEGPIKTKPKFTTKRKTTLKLKTSKNNEATTRQQSASEA